MSTDPTDDVAAFGAFALPPWRERLRLAGHGLGRSPLARRLCSVLRRIVTAGRAGPFDVEAFPGQNARLYPAENLSDKRVFGSAQFWDWRERAALAEALLAVDGTAYMVDAGANAGLYTLSALGAVAGRADLHVLAIEPDPENLARLRFNLAASGAGSVAVAPVALSDRDGVAHLVASHANRGELSLADRGTEVRTRPLTDLVTERGFPQVDALKIDIEGMEAPVLAHYFENAKQDLWPGLVILEAPRRAESEALHCLRAHGYHIEVRTRLNAVLRREPAPGAARK